MSRVLKDWKEKDRTHVDWVKAWLCTLTELQAYVKKYYTTGLTWNPAGGEAKAPVKAGGAPPPPAPRPAPLPGPVPPPARPHPRHLQPEPAPDPAKNARVKMRAALN